ncbi:MAG: glycosyltransferase family 39 protein [Solirubrobacteraceae bacterium]
MTVIGVVLRVLVARQSIFADELSTYWISVTHGFGDVISLLYGSASIHHAEITPPLYFVLAWVTAHLGHSVLLLRLPSLIAGGLSLPVIYLLGRRTVGPRAALVATALTTLSPFMIYYSTEARAYAVMMLLVMASTLAMLIAVESGRARWWVLYAVCACAAVYSHLTCGFVLAGQFLWLLWAHPPARGRAVVASLGAVAGLLPWTVGFLRDFSSPTLKILSALSPFSAHDIPVILGHWAIGYPYANYDAGVAHLPGPVALALLVLATIIAGAGLARRAADPGRGGGHRASVLDGMPKPLILVLVLVLVTPVGEGVVSVFSSHIFGVRNLAASWPGLALGLAALLTAPAPRLRVAAVSLVLGGFAIGAVLMLSATYSRPNYQAAADLINARAAIHAVIDETGEISPGPLTPIDVELTRRVAVFRAGSPAERQHPFGFADPIASLSDAVAGAVAAARGGPIAVVSTVLPPGAEIATRRQPPKPPFPPPYRLLETHVYAGLAPTEVSVYADPAGPRS